MVKYKMNHALYFIREYDRCQTKLENLLQNKNVLDLVLEKGIRQYNAGGHTIYFDVRELPYDNVGLFAKRDCDTKWHFVSKMGGK